MTHDMQGIKIIIYPQRTK